jgi:hypothetical protein
LGVLHKDHGRYIKIGTKRTRVYVKKFQVCLLLDLG